MERFGVRLVIALVDCGSGLGRTQVEDVGTRD